MQHVYVLTGRILPERALLSVGEIKLSHPKSGDLPESHLSVEIILNQVFAKFTSGAAIDNIFSLRNSVEDAVRMIVDVAGYYHGFSYDVEISQLIQINGAAKQVFGIDIPCLKGICEQAGISMQDIFRLQANHKIGYFLRHALSDVREAIRSPKDTGFFCYRAIEALKNLCAVNYNLAGDDKKQWEFFRKRYGIDQQEIMRVKQFADPIRHGNYVEARLMSDDDRANIFRWTWQIINKFIVAEREVEDIVGPTKQA